MNPHEMLKKGIAENDLELIKKASELLEGKEATPVEEPKSEFDFSIRQDGTTVDNDGKRRGRKEPINTDKIGKFNLFEDDLTLEVNDLKDNLNIKYSQHTAQSNRKASLVDVVCIDCGSKHSVHPIHAKKIDGECRYVCDNCILSKRKR